MLTLWIMMGTLLASGILAAAPLLLSRILRPALQSAGGTLCVLGGTAGIFALTSGLVGNWMDEGSVLAAEAAPKASASRNSDESAFFTSAAAAELHSPVQDPIDEVKILGNPPAWVGQNPVRDGSIHTTAVWVGPFTTELEAQRELDKELEKQTDDYVAWALGSALAPRFIHFSADEIRHELVGPGNTYQDTVVSSVGTMKREHALLEFKPEFRERIAQRWKDVKAKWRLAQFGLFAGGAILLLGTVFGYFRLDTATRGYYTGRLQFLSAAAILTIVGAGVMVAQWIAWL